MRVKPRKTRVAFNDIGHAHFLTYSCVDRKPLLRSDRACRWVVSAMEATRKNLLVDFWAYVVMPEHVHVIIYPRSENYEIRKILASLKRPVSKRARQFLESTGNTDWLDRLTVKYPSREVFRLWQPGGGYDRHLFKNRSLNEIVTYVHANPVRRGLVASHLDWKYSSARFWETNDDKVVMRMDTPA